MVHLRYNGQMYIKQFTPCQGELADRITPCCMQDAALSDKPHRHIAVDLKSEDDEHSRISYAKAVLFAQSAEGEWVSFPPQLGAD